MFLCDLCFPLYFSPIRSTYVQTCAVCGGDLGYTRWCHWMLLSFPPSQWTRKQPDDPVYRLALIRLLCEYSHGHAESGLGEARLEEVHALPVKSQGSSSFVTILFASYTKCIQLVFNFLLTRTISSVSSLLFTILSSYGYGSKLNSFSKSTQGKLLCVRDHHILLCQFTFSILNLTSLLFIRFAAYWPDFFTYYSWWSHLAPSSKIHSEVTCWWASSCFQ